MPARISVLLRPILCLFAVAVVLSWTCSSNGQGEGQLGDKQLIETPFQKSRTKLTNMLKGQEVFDAKNKEQTDLLDLCAKFMTYRFTWVTFYAPKDEKDSGKIDGIHNEFEAQLKVILSNNTNRQEIASAYTKAMIVRARDVINLRGPNIARVNAARLMAKLGELGQPDLADALVDVFNQEMAKPRGTERNDGVIYYMLRGMRDLLAAIPPTEPRAKPILSPEREHKMTEALLTFATKPPTFAKDAPKEEIGGYCAMRREAVRALAYCRVPDMKNKDRPGMTLLRIMARDGIKPVPRIDEVVEAAIGVARMRNEIDGKDYQPEYAAYQLALFVDYFVKYHNQFAPDTKDITKITEPRPYKIYATRLVEALEAMKTDTKNPYVGNVVDQCRKVLLPIEKGEFIKTLDLTNWLNGNPSPKEGLFAGVAESTVKAAQP